MRQPIITANDLKLPKVLIKIFGLVNTTYLMIASEWASKTKSDKFKMPIDSIQYEYELTRFVQKACCDYFVEHGILNVSDGEYPKDGKNYQFNKEKVSDINFITTNISTDKELSKFMMRVKNKKIIGKKLELDKVCAIVEKI